MQTGLKLLTKELAGPKPWVRLYAAIALDELDERAAPAKEALQKALQDRGNRYVGRVSERALQALKN